MRVLLLGEYSGFYTNLKKGLLELGVEATLASTSDGWKQINSQDIVLYSPKTKNLISTFFSCIFRPFFSKKQLYGYDVVQIIGPVLYPLSINYKILEKVIDHSSKSFVSVAGDCYSLYKSYKDGLLGYYTFDNNPEACLKYDYKDKKKKRRIKQEIDLYNRVDGIIPIMYEYSIGVKPFKNCLNTIPLPFDASSVEYEDNVVSNRIVIAHGIIKEKYKGTDIILEALSRIKEKYPDKVEIMVDGKMPLSDYLLWLKKANILVDQCKEHCYGMNALYAMAEGKVVLGGASEMSLKEYGVKNCPVVHIEPNADMIEKKLEELINNPSLITKIGKESRSYVETFHDCKRIAKLYVDCWNSL